MVNGPTVDGLCNGCNFLRDKGTFFCAHPTAQRKVLGSDAQSIVRYIGKTDDTPSWCPFLAVSWSEKEKP